MNAYRIMMSPKKGRCQSEHRMTLSSTVCYQFFFVNWCHRSPAMSATKVEEILSPRSSRTMTIIGTSFGRNKIQPLSHPWTSQMKLSFCGGYSNWHWGQFYNFIAYNRDAPSSNGERKSNKHSCSTSKLRALEDYPYQSRIHMPPKL